VSTSFDPYRDWLGIDGGSSSADCYRVFGLPKFTADPQAISSAADSTINRIRRLPAGPARERFIAELHEAKRLLLDPESRARYDAKLRSTQPAMGDESALAPQAEALWEEVTRAPYRPRSPRDNRSRSDAPLLGVLVGLAGLLAGGGWVLWQTQAEPAAEPTVIRIEIPKTGVSEGQAANELASADPAGPSNPAPPAVSDAPAANPAPSAAEPQTAQPAPLDAKKSPAASTAFERAIADAREALAARDLSAASKHLAAAEKLGSAPGQRDQVRQLRALSEQLALFLDAVRAGLKKYGATEEIDIDGTIAAIIETRMDGVTLFIEGSRRAYTIANMPAKVALFFARSAADEDDPRAAVFFAAFHAVDPQGDRGRARAMWQPAAAAGQPVDDLLPLVAGVPLTIERQPVPDAAELSAARDAIREQFAEAIVKARSPAERALVATQLLGAGAAAKDPAERYAALDEARTWAVAGGSPLVALEAIDHLGKSFDVDVLELKSKALGTAVAGAANAKSSAAAATVAISLSAEAQRAGRADLALSLADTAYAAARKARDSVLIKRAYARRGEAQAAVKESRDSKASRSGR
jgi:hypothetical protein